MENAAELAYKKWELLRRYLKKEIVQSNDGEYPVEVERQGRRA